MPPKGKKKANKKGGTDDEWGDKDDLTLDAVAKKVAQIPSKAKNAGFAMLLSESEDSGSQDDDASSSDSESDDVIGKQKISGQQKGPKQLTTVRAKQQTKSQQKLKGRQQAVSESSASESEPDQLSEVSNVMQKKVDHQKGNRKTIPSSSKVKGTLQANMEASSEDEIRRRNEQATSAKPSANKKKGGKKTKKLSSDSEEGAQPNDNQEMVKQDTKQKSAAQATPKKKAKGGKKGNRRFSDSEEDIKGDEKQVEMPRDQKLQSARAKKKAGKKGRQQAESTDDEAPKPTKQVDVKELKPTKQDVKSNVSKGAQKQRPAQKIDPSDSDSAGSDVDSKEQPPSNARVEQTKQKSPSQKNAPALQMASNASGKKGKKSKKGKQAISDSDEVSIEERAKEPTSVIAKKKQKGGKNDRRKMSASDVESETSELPSTSVKKSSKMRSKKGKKGKRAYSSSSSSADEAEVDDIEPEERKVDVTEPKGGAVSSHQTVDDVLEDAEEASSKKDEGTTQQRAYAPLAFGKKKKAKPKKEEPPPPDEEVPFKFTDVQVEEPEAPAEESEVDDWEAMAEQMDSKKEEKKKLEAAKAVEAAEAAEKKEAESREASKAAASSIVHDAPKATKKGGKKGRNVPNNAPDPQSAIPEDAQLRSPILCIMGHVDTGKTKLLDKIRRTNVQDKEAGGITQQIGATFFPRENLILQCSKVEQDLQLRVPGLLIIDTPGHASFNNLRKRGSSLCDVAILVVDIMHGLEPQTKESIALLRQRKCPFVVALNKIDRLYGWVACEWQPCKQAIDRQKRHVRDEFEDRARKVLLQLTSEEGLNCEIYWRNTNMRKNLSVVPTSAITGEGIPDLLTLIVKLTQQLMVKQIVLDVTNIECTVLEVKTIEGLGTTIDVILVSGVLHEGDTIVVCGMNGPIVTTIRALLTPHPMKELRVKGEYVHHESLSAAMGVKIAGNGLEEAVAGTSMMVAKNPNDEDEIERLKDEVQEDMGAIFKTVDKSQDGVYVMASTLGSLEALLDFLKESKIPVSGINIGTVWKLDVKKASTMRERGREEYSVILAFDVKIDAEAEKEAKVLGVKIFSADIIYHLFDSFTKHLHDFKENKKKEALSSVVFPCILTIIPEYVFNKKDPLILGVRVDDGEVKVGTPLGVIDEEKKIIKLGTIASLELNKKPVPSAVKNQEVCIKITGDSSVTYGRHFDHKQKLYSLITRSSIDTMKQHYKEDLEKHVRLVVALKKILGVV